MPENKLKGGYRIKMHQPKHCSPDSVLQMVLV